MVCLENKQRSFCCFWDCTKYCISDSFVDYYGYSISSKGFFPTVVDITVMWVKLTISVHFSSLIPRILTFTLAISCLTTSNLPWFMDLTFSSIPHAQGKRNPSKMVDVARGHQRADTLKPYSQKTSQTNHTRTTALSNSMEPRHACGQPTMGGSWWRGLTKCGPLEKGMANQFSILALRTPWRQNDKKE